LTSFFILVKLNLRKGGAMKIKVSVLLMDKKGEVLTEIIHIRIGLVKYLKARLVGAFWRYGKLSPLWQNELPLWIVYCPTHGFTITYPMGYDEKIQCRFCLREAYRKM